MPTEHFPIWLIWRDLNYLYRLFFLILTLVSTYTLFSATLVLTRLRSLKKRLQIMDASSCRRLLAKLEHRAMNARRLIVATFYLFGFIFFLKLPFATVTLGDSHVPLGNIIWENFVAYFMFAANVYLILLILHSVQWFVSSRIYSFVRRWDGLNSTRFRTSGNVG
jgi:hypothetical protein